MGRRRACLWVLILVVLVRFDSYGWRLVVVVDKLFDHERKRKKKMLVGGGDLAVRKGRRKKLKDSARSGSLRNEIRTMKEA